MINALYILGSGRPDGASLGNEPVCRDDAMFADALKCRTSIVKDAKDAQLALPEPMCAGRVAVESVGSGLVVFLHVI